MGVELLAMFVGGAICGAGLALIWVAWMFWRCDND